MTVTYRFVLILLKQTQCQGLRLHPYSFFDTRLHPSLRMLATYLLASAFATLACSALEKRQTCGDAITPSFHLIATTINGSARYPLNALFPASCSSQLRLAAKTSGPGAPWNETVSSVFNYGPGNFQTNHTACHNPNGDPVTFTTGGVSAGDQVTLSQTPAAGSEYRLQCVRVPTGGRGFWTFGNNDNEFSWSLCDGDQVDQVLGRSILHWQGTNPSCFKVNLIPEKA